MLVLPPIPPVTGFAARVRLPRDYYVRLGSNDYSASTVAGIRGSSLSSAWMAASTAVIPESYGARTYVGGPAALTAFAAVFREIPSHAAIDLIDRPISAQSSTVTMAQISTVTGTPARAPGQSQRSRNSSPWVETEIGDTGRR
jgi:hypothetical protein